MMIIQRETKNGNKSTTLEGFLWIRNKQEGGDDDDDSVSSLESLASFGSDEDEEKDSNDLPPKCPRTPTARRTIRQRPSLPELECGQVNTTCRPRRSSDNTPSRPQQRNFTYRRTMTNPGAMRKNTSERYLFKNPLVELQDEPALMTTASGHILQNSNTSTCSRWTSQSRTQDSIVQEYLQAPSRSTDDANHEESPKVKCYLAGTDSTHTTSMLSGWTASAKSDDLDSSSPSRVSNTRSRRRFSSLGSPRITVGDTSALRRIRVDPLKRSNHSASLRKHRLQSLCSGFDCPRLPPRRPSIEKEQKTGPRARTFTR